MAIGSLGAWKVMNCKNRSNMLPKLNGLLETIQEKSLRMHRQRGYRNRRRTNFLNQDSLALKAFGERGHRPRSCGANRAGGYHETGERGVGEREHARYL